MDERFYFTYMIARQKTHPGFTARYNCGRLVWFESFSEVSAAIQREKEIKGWTRARKIALIELANPTWEDLSGQWFPTLVARRVK
jgi:putative endonuclease